MRRPRHPSASTRLPLLAAEKRRPCEYSASCSHSSERRQLRRYLSRHTISGHVHRRIFDSSASQMGWQLRPYSTAYVRRYTPVYTRRSNYIADASAANHRNGMSAADAATRQDTVHTRCLRAYTKRDGR